MIREAFFLAAYDLPVWLLRLVFSVTLVCIAAFLATMLLRRFSAAMRHRVWALSVAASLAMPVMILWSPEVRLGWLTVPNPRAEVTADIPKVVEKPAAASATRLPRPIKVSKNESHPSQPAVSSQKKASPSKAAPAKGPLVATGDRHPDAASDVPRTGIVIPRTQPSHVSLIDPTTFWLLLLVIPAVCGIWQSVWAACAIRRVVNEARPIQDPATRELVADVCRRLGWRGTIELRQSTRTPIPLCVGWLRPCVLVPSQWRNWGDLTLRAVLAHEVSHVVRRDVAWQFVARVACFLYWFHPMVWLAARKMRTERESACDDTVLGMVERPVDYASVLLRFAREMVARSVPSEAVAMAGLSGLEDRVRAILDKGRPRAPVGRGLGRLFAAAAVLVAAGAASLSPLSRDISGMATANDSASFRENSDRITRLTNEQVIRNLFDRNIHQHWSDHFQSNGQSRGAAISGRVVLNSDPQQGVARAKILGIPENPKASYVTAVADSDGYFFVPRIRSAMLFLAQNEKRMFSGIARIEPQESGVVIPVGRSVTAHGRLLDATGKPLGSWPLEYCLVLDGSYLDEFHVAQSRDVKKLLGGMAQTGPNGEFWLAGLAPGWAYRISCCPGTVVNGTIQPFVMIANFTPDQSEITQLGDVKRPRTQTMDDVFLNASSPPEQIEKVLETATENAKLLDQRVLMLSGSPKNETFRAIHAILAVSSPVAWTPGPGNGAGPPKWSKDSYVQAALFNYSVVGLEVVGPDATTGAFLKNHKFAMPAADDLVLTVLGDDGKIVAETSGRQLFAGKAPSARPLSDWLQQHAPKLPDAEKLLADALNQAKRENKLVFLRETAPQAGPYCTRLARYVEEYKDLIEKDYVCLKIDVRCPNAETVINRIRDYDMGGMSFPWMVILDGAGKPLVSSTSPHGNIGAPVSAQEASYFAWMLRATAQRLTEEEVATLVSALTKNKS
jgi:beta-lactamase regulating signal transducer with metallopeptidase domain